MSPGLERWQIRELVPDDLPQLAQLLHQAYSNYGRSLADYVRSLQETPFVPGRTCYVGLSGERVVASYVLIDFQTMVAGQSLHCGGIASVAITLDKRKQGLAGRLLQHALERMLERDMPISTLYPFRYDFYARYGWGAVGEAVEHRYNPRDLRCYPEGTQLEPVERRDLEGLASCYATMARHHTGMTMRPVTHWEALLQREPDRVFVYRGGRGVEAYLLLELEPDPRGSSRLQTQATVKEYAASTAEGRRALVGFLSRLDDQVLRVLWYAPVGERLELHATAPGDGSSPGVWHDNPVSRRLASTFMLRVVDLEKALLSRTDYAGQSFGVRLEVDDPQVARNREPLILEVGSTGEGHARVRRGTHAEGTLRTRIDTFSQIFSGYLTASEACEAHLASCDPDLLPRLDAAFSTPRRPFSFTFF